MIESKPQNQLKQTNQIEAGFMKRMNSCLIRVVLMKLMTPQIVI